ncbi:hypothetical protein JCM1840_006013 [Sporobolomyces johnsonii]
MGRKKPSARTPPTTFTAFRSAERFWKDRSTPLDLSLAFDPQNIVWDDAPVDGPRRGVWTSGDGSTEDCWKVSLSDLSETGMGQSRWKGKDKQTDGDYAVVVPRVPGLVVFPSILPEALQRSLVVESLQHARLPNLTSLDKHYDLPEGGLWNAWAAGKGEQVVPRVDGGPPKANSDGTRLKRERVCFEPVTKENWHEVKGRGVSMADEPEERAALESRSQTPDEAVVRDATVAELLPKLRWSNVGWHYDWTSKIYDFDRPFVSIPPTIRLCCRELARKVPWRYVFDDEEVAAEAGEGKKPDWHQWAEHYEPDAGIVNFYQLRDSLTAHIDHSEVDAVRPLVSFSIGHSAIFLVGGRTRDVPPLAVLLRSGDGLIMSGKEGRRVFHGLPRVLSDSLPDYLASDQPEPVHGTDDWRCYGEYLERGARINVNVRSVF